LGKKEISFKGRLEQQKLVGYLEELLAGLKSGTVFIQHGDDFVRLSPTELVEFEVEASQKKGKEKLTLEISWLVEGPTDSDSELKITTSEPAAESEESVENEAAEG
jgi:amphi-Trp domain-containing protein